MQSLKKPFAAIIVTLPSIPAAITLFTSRMFSQGKNNPSPFSEDSASGLSRA
jgi:hypothetical protein